MIVTVVMEVEKIKIQLLINSKKIRKNELGCEGLFFGNVW
jgi:hypothetical protein